TNCWLIKREYITKNKTRFRKDVSWGEDFEFFCKILANTKKVCYVNEYLTNYVVDHNDEQLSNFSLDKIDDDYKLILRLTDNKEINKNKNVEKALINFRLQGRIVYQLTAAINKNYPSKQINYY